MITEQGIKIRDIDTRFFTKKECKEKCDTLSSSEFKHFDKTEKIKFATPLEIKIESFDERDA